MHTKCAQNKPCTFPTQKVYRKSVQYVHKECTSHAPLQGWKLYCTTERPKCCTICARIIHILCTLCTHNPNCYAQYLHFVCSKICIACTMCAHFVEIENIILFALCILSFPCSFSLSLLYCISRFRKHICLIKHEPSTLTELRKAFKSSIFVV